MSQDFTQTEIEAERVAFEAWAEQFVVCYTVKQLRRHDGSYNTEATRMRWEAWLARAKTARDERREGMRLAAEYVGRALPSLSENAVAALVDAAALHAEKELLG